jgi:hypothetical protein
VWIRRQPEIAPADDRDLVIKLGVLGPELLGQRLEQLERVQLIAAVAGQDLAQRHAL